MLSPEAIKRLRLSRNLTQKDVADEAGISTRWYKEIETGRKNPSDEAYNKIVNAIYDLPDRTGEVRMSSVKKRTLGIKD